MTLGELKKYLNDISEQYPDAYSAKAKVATWDDNAYDGKDVVGLRVNYDIGTENGIEATVFIIADV